MPIKIINISRPHSKGYVRLMEAKAVDYTKRTCRNLDDESEEMYIHMINEAFKAGYRAGRKSMRWETK